MPEIKTNLSNQFDQSVIDFDKYSQLHKLQRTFAYVQRFISNCKNKNNLIIGELTVSELQRSLKLLAQLSQRDSFTNEIMLLSNKKPLNSRSRILSLAPYMDADGILRVGGRIQNASYCPYNKIHPILIDSKHTFTKLLFVREHLRLFHCGPQQLLSSLREQFWPIGGRQLAKTIVHKCIICVRAKGKTLQPIMGNLPQSRVTPAPPFETCGVDFAGPFLISSRKGRGAKTSKCYLCLFICFATKALHLEVVSDLSTNAFILSLRRFISRRGKPKMIYCDNGTNFVGANNELNRMLRACRWSVDEFASSEGIEFKFNPAYSPNFGEFGKQQ